MIKYIPEDTCVVFREVPDEVSLALNISNCQNHCPGCHTPYLRDDIGDELTEDVLLELIESNKGISCVCFMGEGKDIDALISLSNVIHSKGLKTALYSGRWGIENKLHLSFDYIKVGPYIEHYGPLDSKTTNQRMYKKNLDGTEEDITYRFWDKDVQ